MKIYAIRDRMIDYYQNPFVGPDDRNVMAAVAQRVNGDNNDPVHQAPHHFELWQLGEVQEDGTLTARREILCQCDQLVRSNLRKEPERGAAASGKPPEGLPTAPGRPQGHA